MTSILLAVATLIGLVVGTVPAADPRIVGPYGDVPPVYPSRMYSTELFQAPEVS